MPENYPICPKCGKPIRREVVQPMSGVPAANPPPLQSTVPSEQSGVLSAANPVVPPAPQAPAVDPGTVIPPVNVPPGMMAEQGDPS